MGSPGPKAIGQVGPAGAAAEAGEAASSRAGLREQDALPRGQGFPCGFPSPGLLGPALVRVTVVSTCGKEAPAEGPQALAQTPVGKGAVLGWELRSVRSRDSQSNNTQPRYRLGPGTDSAQVQTQPTGRPCGRATRAGRRNPRSSLSGADLEKCRASSDVIKIAFE